MRDVADLATLAERYDVFFVDQFGVLHDGTLPYLGAVEALVAMKAAGKTVVLLSNSGKRSAANERRLIDLGFRPGSWDLFLTSGEVAWERLRSDSAIGNGKRCLLLARDGDTGAVDGLDLELVRDPAHADVVLLAGSEGDRLTLDEYHDLLAGPAAAGVPCLCTNPDRIMLTPTGPAFGAGRIAELYEAMGGPVTWIGKPFPEIYHVALETVGGPDRRGSSASATASSTTSRGPPPSASRPRWSARASPAPLVSPRSKRAAPRPAASPIGSSRS